MPLKKIEWGDIPNIAYVKDKDLFGTWIECKICDVKIRVRSQFCFTEWNTHYSGVKHSKIANSKALKDVPKIDAFFFFFFLKGQHLKKFHWRYINAQKRLQH